LPLLLLIGAATETLLLPCMTCLAIMKLCDLWLKLNGTPVALACSRLIPKSASFIASAVIDGVSAWASAG
jgi:hypothetical protein